MATTQRWELDRDGQHHELTAEPGALRRTLVWRIDGETVVERTSTSERLQLEHGALALDVRFSALGAGRRATLHEVEEGSASGKAKDKAELGLGGVDLVPEPDSPAARHEQWLLDHPRLHTLRATAGATAGVLVPILLAALLARFAFSFDLPDLPLPDLPDLPSIPLPDLPSIPLPDISLPDWSLPGWVEQVGRVLKFVFPVLLAVALARAELRRRRSQEELRRRPESDQQDEESDER